MAATTTSPEVAPLVRILTREQAIYQKLLDVAAEEREAIVAGTLPQLKQALQRKQDILAKLSELEDSRVEWLQRFTRKRRLSADTVTLASIIEVSSAADGQALSRLHRGLRRRIDRLIQVNAVTKTLLDGVLSSIDVSLHFLLAGDGVSQTYGARGRLESGPALNRQLLECQA